MPFTLILYVIYDCKSWHELNGKHIIYDSNWIMTANTNHELEAPIYIVYIESILKLPLWDAFPFEKKTQLYNTIPSIDFMAP